MLFLGYMKAYMDCDIGLALQKIVAHLNAPFNANWNDYPLTVEIVPAAFGWIARLTGLLIASNLMYLSAHILAGISFWYAGTMLRYRLPYVLAGSILFAFSHYIFARNYFQHPTLSYYWHIPLFILSSGWVIRGDIVNDKFKFRFSLAVSVITGIFSPYYSFIYIHFLFFGSLLNFIRRKNQQAKYAIYLIFATMFGFIVMNMDTLTYQWMHGENPNAIVRNLSSLIYYGLKLPDLFYPPFHRWEWWASFAQEHYHGIIQPHGEGISPYLGVVGIAGFLWLMGLSTYRLLQGKTRLIPTPAWQIIWVILYGIMGGVNLLIGSLGWQLFRATNRYSIIILTLALLFLIRQLSRYAPSPRRAVTVSLLLLTIGLWDQLPIPVTSEAIAQSSQAIKSDAAFAKRLQQTLPENAMVFQLPVASYPEVPPIHRMKDYEHFRPYLHTKNLRYSYGNTKGRGEEDWQKEVAALPATVMIEALQRYGFDALYINRKGYKDNADNLVDQIRRIGKPVIAESGELIAFRLAPSEIPVFPQ